MVTEHELYHYGVLGMRWGRRKGKNESRVDVSQMSDAELRNHLNRMQMEQQYKKLSQNDISTGRDAAGAFMRSVMMPAAKEAGRNYVKIMIARRLAETIIFHRSGY